MRTLSSQFPKNLLLILTRGCAAASLLLFASCSTTSGPRSLSDSTVTVPQTWQNSMDASSTAPQQPSAENLATWWTRFDDPTLNELITRALQTSPDVRTAVSKLAESRARRGIERASLLPTLSAGASARTSRSDDHTTNPHTVTTGESYAASLDASWEIDLFGKNYQSLKAANADLAQAQQNLYAAQVSLAAEVATSYVSLRSAEAQLAVVQENLRTREETTQITRWRAEAGSANALELQQAISTLEQARSNIPSLNRTITQTRNQLSLLCGLTPGSLDTLLKSQISASQATASIPKSDTPTVGIPADTLRQRPDIRGAEYAFTAATARLKSAERDRLPTLNLTGSIGVESLQAGHLFDPSKTVASALGSLTAPIFAAGRIQQNIVIQNELTKQALIAYENTVLTALTDVENALIYVQRTTERIAIIDRATTAAREAASLAAIQYEAGQIDITTLLDAQRTELALQEQQVTTTADLTTAQIQLYKALGGGWSTTN